MLDKQKLAIFSIPCPFPASKLAVSKSDLHAGVLQIEG